MGLLDKLKGSASASKAYDPVCGMTIDPKKAAGTSTYQGKTVYFCSAGCKQQFDANPASFASKIK